MDSPLSRRAVMRAAGGVALLPILDRTGRPDASAAALATHRAVSHVLKAASEERAVRVAVLRLFFDHLAIQLFTGGAAGRADASCARLPAL